MDVLPTLEASSIDLILTDLPYGITRNKWDAVIPLDRLWAEFRRVRKPTAVTALFGGTAIHVSPRNEQPDGVQIRLVLEETQGYWALERKETAHAR